MICTIMDRCKNYFRSYSEDVATCGRTSKQGFSKKHTKNLLKRALMGQRLDIWFLRVMLISLFLLWSTNVFAIKITFVPTSYADLKKDIDRLKDNKELVKKVEKGFKFDDGLDGIKGKKSKCEEAFYASIVFGETKRAVLDAGYYLARSKEVNPEGYRYVDTAFILDEVSKVSFKTTGKERLNVAMKAHYDHLVINNKDGKALLKAGRGDLVELIVNTFEDDSKENFEKIIQELVKEKENANAANRDDQICLNFIFLAESVVGNRELNTKMMNTYLRLDTSEASRKFLSDFLDKLESEKN